MKYQMIPTIFKYCGIFLGVVLFITAIVNQDQISNDMYAVLISASIAVIGFYGSLANEITLHHHKRILKKHGLWQDE